MVVMPWWPSAVGWLAKLSAAHLLAARVDDGGIGDILWLERPVGLEPKVGRGALRVHGCVAPCYNGLHSAGSVAGWGLVRAARY